MSSIRCSDAATAAAANDYTRCVYLVLNGLETLTTVAWLPASI